MLLNIEKNIHSSSKHWTINYHTYIYAVVHVHVFMSACQNTLYLLILLHATYLHMCYKETTRRDRPDSMNEHY